MQQKGFTLIELLIVLAIVAILAAIAIPAYRNYIISSELTDATNALAAYRIKMEQWYQDNGNYGTSGCGVSVPTSKYFTYTCALQSNGQTYLATATGSPTYSLSGYVYTINDAGDQVTTAFPNVAVPKPCWVIRSGDC